MADLESPGLSRVCPACGRRVPGKVSTCRCGQALADVPMTTAGPIEFERDSPRESRASFIVKMGVLILAVVGSFYWLMRRPTAPPAKPAVATPATVTTRTIPIPSPPPAPSQSPAAPAAPPADPQTPPPPTSVTRESSGDLPQPSSLPLEDIVEHAMPGVVMIQTDKTRGSGFLVRPDLVVTNAHVTAGYLYVTVTSQTGIKMQGRVSQFSDEYDIALIQVGRFGPTDAQLPLGNSADLRLGQGVVALGWAQSLKQSTVTRGIITGLRQMGDRQMMQTDAAPNPGDSGGPVINRAGEVVGVTTFRFDGNTDHPAGGLAVPIDDVKPFIEKIFGSVLTLPRSAGAVLVPRPSPADVQRGLGTQRYSNDLAAVASRASALDGAWSRYRAACKITSVPAGQTHEWFALYDPASPLHRTPPYCVSVLNDVERQADAINAAMLAAEETARHGDVFPGTRRDLRRRFRLDYSGWDR